MGEVRVAIEASGVAYADIAMRQGMYRSVALPVTPGYDFVGRIEALGPGVSNFSVGQRVAAVTVWGSYANRRNVDANLLVPAPEGVAATSLVAAVLNGLTAWQMFHRIARPEPSEWILVHGAAGGVGSLLLDLAKLAGVKAIGTASSRKRAVVQSRGGVAIDYEHENVLARVLEISQGGVTAAFDHIGGKHFKRVTLPSLRATGIGVLYGGYDATRGGKVHPLAVANLLVGGYLSSFRLFSQCRGAVGYSIPNWYRSRPDVCRTDLEEVLQLVADGSLVPLIAEVLPMEEAGKAHRLLESRAVSGKIVLENRFDA